MIISRKIEGGILNVLVGPRPFRKLMEAGAQLPARSCDSGSKAEADSGEKSMNPECNPIRKKGERNVFCPYYNDCLDFVINHAWEGWDCRECRHRSNWAAAPEISLTVNPVVEYYEIII